MAPDFPGEERDLRFFPIRNDAPRHLTPEQIAHYNERGYVFPLDVFSGEEIAAHRAYFDGLTAMAEAAGLDNYGINAWHTSCAGIYDLVTEGRILDYVQDLLGETVILWGSHYFNKLPGDGKRVSWHQDATFWALSPSKTVTVWLALDDTDVDNGAMTLIPGSHLHGAIEYVDSRPEENNVLWQTVEGAPQYGAAPVPVELRAGQMSLHTDLLLHGSEPNLSDRRRCGLTMRFIPGDVVRTLPDWNSGAILCRGAEPNGHFNYIARPDGDRIPEKV
ncbi:MAG: phytanoyl-CoA dioxygenase family protein [Anaerolineaceae bacterium]|nr:phytanoyl-CoA dioxygenase family protein [Anaerolineaceae bacterium]